MRILADDGGDIQRGGQIIDDSVQQGLNALVTVRSTAQHGRHTVVHRSMTDTGLDFFNGQGLGIIQILLHQVVVFSGDGLHQLLMHQLSLIQQIRRNRFLANVLALVVIVDFGFHGNQVDDAAEGGLSADGKLDRNGIRAQTIFHHLHNAHEVRTHDIHLVDVGDAGHAILGSLAPYRLTLRLNAALGAEHSHSAVQHAQGALDLHGEVHVTGGVDDVDTVAKPLASGSGRLDGDAAFLLLCHKVHGGAALVGFAKTMYAPGIKQDAFGCGRFAGVDVCHDADIAYLFKRMASGHGMRNLLTS